MLCYDIRSLESRAVQVDDELPTDDPVWLEGDSLPSGNITVEGRLSAAGPGRFYFSGTVAGGVVVACRRCLADAAAAVTEDANFLYAEPGVEGDADDDPDVYALDSRARELDLRPAIREQWLLISPAYALCRPDCKGLCKQCGADLNEGPCGCAVSTDRHSDGLRDAPPVAE